VVSVIGELSKTRVVPAAVFPTLSFHDRIAVTTAAMAIRHDPRIAAQIRPETRPWITSVMLVSPLREGWNNGPSGHLGHRGKRGPQMDLVSPELNTPARPARMFLTGVYPSVESMTARDFFPATKFTLVSPNMSRSLLAGRFLIGPGPTAMPGTGCGKAVERAV
jgi:hypothetical protein